MKAQRTRHWLKMCVAGWSKTCCAVKQGVQVVSVFSSCRGHLGSRFPRWYLCGASPIFLLLRVLLPHSLVDCCGIKTVWS